MSRMFSRWSREKVVEWLDHLEPQVASSVDSVTNPDTGTVAYNNAQAQRIIDLLYQRLDILDGKRPQRPRFVTIVPRYHFDR